MQTVKQAYALLEENRLEEAMAAFAQIIAIDPQQSEAHLGLGQLFMHIEEFDRAIEHFNACCSQQADNYHALIELATAFQAVNSHEDVATLYNYILTKFAHVPEVLYQSSLYYSQVGQIDSAKQYIQACLSILTAEHPLLLHAHAWLLSVKLDKRACTKNTLDIITALKSSAAPQSTQEMVLEYVCADIYEALGDVKAAFTSWQTANAIGLKHCDANIASLCEFMQSISSSPKATASNVKPDTEFTPIFIVGLARTGSTLLEQLLNQHSKVSTMGEVTIVSNQVARYFSQKYQLPYPSFLPRLSPEDCTIGAQIYMNAVSKRQIRTPFVVDKLPANFQSLGLIKAIFPQAKIIHLQRDLTSVALSTFKHYFAHNEANFCDIANIKQYHQAYMALMNYWQKEAGIEYLDIHYKDLVSKPQQTIESILEYCHLPFEEHIVDAQNKHIRTSTQPIKTLSALQVRAPISDANLHATNPYKEMLAVYDIQK